MTVERQDPATGEWVPDEPYPLYISPVGRFLDMLIAMWRKLWR